MGATFIGIPIILILISLRGFIFGFTLSFLVNRLQRKGIVFAMVSMLPSNIFILPALIIIGVVAINFALYVFRNRSNGISNLVKDFIGYTIVIASIFLLIILGSFIEAYFSVYLIKVFIS
jgi:stage II sporulation protein M